MDVWTALKIAFRRWYVSVPVLVLAFFVAREVAERQEVTYETSASLVLVVPGTVMGSDNQPVNVNPYLSFSSSLNATASALSLVMSSVTKQVDLQSQGLTAAYQVEQEGPVLTFRVTGGDASTVIGTAGALIAESQNELAELQATVNAPESQLIRTDVLTNPAVAEETAGGGDRAFLAVVGVGVVAAVSMSLLLESAVTYRRIATARRRRAVTERGAPTGSERLPSDDEDLSDQSGIRSPSGEPAEPYASETSGDRNEDREPMSIEANDEPSDDRGHVNVEASDERVQVQEGDSETVGTGYMSKPSTPQ